jgi:predicted MFS family arabinose efflux permease
MHQSTFALFMNGRLGLGARDIGWAFVAGGIGSVLVQGILVSRVIDRVGEEKTAQIGIAVIGLSFILFLNAMSLIHAILFMALYAGGIGLVRPSITTAVSRRTDMAQGKSMGILQGFDSLGRVIGPSLGGLLLDTRLTLAYTGAIGILAFALIFFRVSSRIKRAPRNSAD